MTLSETLRKACAANWLGVSGSADQLLARLCRGGKTAKSAGKTAPTLFMIMNILMSMSMNTCFLILFIS